MGTDMELLCPHCVKRVTVSDDKSGQVLNCPLCNGVFAAPSLAPAPGRTPPPMDLPPPAPAPNMEITASAPVGMAPTLSPPPPQAPPPRPEPPRPAPPPGDYTRKLAFRLRPDILVFVPPVCLLLIFVLSFFPWHDVPSLQSTAGQILWQLAFGEHGSGVFTVYVLCILLALPLSIACVLFELRWVPTPSALAPLMPWKSLLTLLVLAVMFLLFCYDYQQAVFSVVYKATLWELIAFRLHFIATAAAALEVWAQGQQARNRPLPRFTLKW
jgi:hypothetical protein